MSSNLYTFIENLYTKITNTSQETKEILIGYPIIESDCNEILTISQTHPFISLQNANIYKQVANVVIHIFYASPAEKPIIQKGFLNLIKNKELKVLHNDKNHQNALIAIIYGLYLINKEDDFSQPINISCHTMVDWVQTLLTIDITKEENLLSATKFFSLLFEQTTYKCNLTKEYPHCPIF